VRQLLSGAIFKQLVLRLARRAGYEIHRLEPPGERAEVFTREAIDLAIDVGANRGQWALLARRREGYVGRIVSFEPLRDVHAELALLAAADGNWETFPFALGDRESRATLNRAQSSLSSSFLPVEARVLEVAPHAAYVGEEEVEIKALDSFGLGGRIYLKIDVQGYERHVLDGATTTLRSCRAVEVETALISRYPGEELFPQLFDRLSANGLYLYAIWPNVRNRQTGEIVEFNAIFVRG
jgi:FkbM family methyltransferase